MFTDFSINCWSELNNERLSLCLAGSDAQSHQRRALASLQSTIAEHVEQLKDMEKRTLMVSEWRLLFFSHLIESCSRYWWVVT